MLFSFPVQPFEQFIFGYYDPLQSFEKLIKVLGRIISAYVELIMQIHLACVTLCVVVGPIKKTLCQIWVEMEGLWECGQAIL